MYNLINCKVIISKNVVFDEEAGQIQHENEKGVQFKTSTKDEAPITIAQQQQPPLNSPNSSSLTSYDEASLRKFRPLRVIYATT